MDLLYVEILKYIAEVIIFFILMVIFDFIFKKIHKSTHRILNPKEYFPDEEIHSLNQIFYLIMMGLCFINVLYTLVFIGSDLLYFVIFDIILSLYLAVKLDKSTLKNKIILFILIPFGSLTYLIFGNTLVGIMDLIHIPIYIYFIKQYYDKFREYTVSNGLGITIILLFIIILVSFLFTIIVEDVSPMDSITMVSNAFTSNSFYPSGKIMIGKLNSLVLAWGGFILSGVGTATLVVSMVMRYVSRQFEDMKDLIEEKKKNK